MFHGSTRATRATCLKTKLLAICTVRITKNSFGWIFGEAIFGIRDKGLDTKARRIVVLRLLPLYPVLRMGRRNASRIHRCN
jgi:hypothetical protein